MSRRIVIVGGVAGGASAAAKARRTDESAQIVMFERGPYVSFANCGLPYYVSGKISRRDSLLLQTPERFRERFRIEAKCLHEVLRIDRQKKFVEVRDIASGKLFEEPYGRRHFGQRKDADFRPRYLCSGRCGRGRATGYGQKDPNASGWPRQ